MSHCLGVRCSACHGVLTPDDNCPECPDGGHHGYGYQNPGEFMRQHWPDHVCSSTKVPMGVEPHEPTDTCWGVHCFSHNVDEPHEPCFRYCGECYHVFPTEQALIDDDNAVWASYGQTVPNRDPDDIHCCPHCTHDF